MAIVLDGAVAAGVPLGNLDAEKHVEAALAAGRCFMTLASVSEFACIVAQGAGQALADHWVAWIYTNEDIEIVEERHKEYMKEGFMLLVVEACLRSGLYSPSCSAAALARRMNIPVLTNREGFRELEQQGFCSVVWATTLDSLT